MVICALFVCCSDFVGVIEQLFDEEVLIGSGWTARETIRCVCACVCAVHTQFMCTFYTCIQPFKKLVVWGSYGLHLTNTCLLQFISLCSYTYLLHSLHLPCACPRSLAYSILADLVHHVRAQLTLNHLALAVELFSRNIHDDCLPTSIQIMSCKVCKKRMVMYIQYVCTYQCSPGKVV